MRAPQCSRERDVITAILAGGWPARCDEFLHAHVMQCELCRDLADVVFLLQADRELLRDVGLPSAGQVWWRAAIRARLDASQQASRPLAWLFGVTVACVVGLAMAAIELLWAPMQAALIWSRSGGWTPSSALSQIVMGVPELTPPAQVGLLLLLGAIACLLLAPLALYFALSDE